MYIPASQYEKKYLETGGEIYPIRSSENIESTSGVEIINDICIQNIVCRSCGSEWDDVYNLIGIDNLKLSPNQTNNRGE